MDQSRNPVIGVDFDNTLVTYDRLLHAVAVECGLLPSSVEKNKKNIRDHIRRMPNGEIEWRRLQAIVYGVRIGEAELIDGVRAFFEQCKSAGVKVYIVSHKTEFVRHEGARINLQTAALNWMDANRFFETDSLGISLEDVFFTSNRQEKIERIQQLGCTHFIDDLEETFLEETFPAGVEKILYAPFRSSAPPGMKVVNAWQEISEYFFATT